MEEIVLNAEPRDVTGKAVKYLRREGYVPAVVYGHRTEPISLKVQERALRQALTRARGNRLITLTVEGLEEPKHVLAREVQRDALSHAMLHIDFYEVVMTEKITTDLPIVLVGEALPVSKGEGLLFQGLDSIEIECLPGDLPPHVEVNLANLTAIDQTVFVRDLKLGDAIEILTEPDEVVVKILPLEKEEIEEVAPVEAAVPEVEVLGKKKPEVEAEEAAKAEKEEKPEKEVKKAAKAEKEEKPEKEVKKAAKAEKEEKPEKEVKRAAKAEKEQPKAR